MSLSDAIFTLLIGPLKTLFDIIFSCAYKLTSNPGLSVIGLSIAMNLLLLPLYNRTDAIQLEAIETEKRLKPFVTHIKKTFKGNEQFMMLKTCYRQNHYKPADAIKGISPLLLEIPFFMAAYNYLSDLPLLYEAQFGPISNLSFPDGILSIGGLTINVLPIAMTVINLVSSCIYTKDAPFKTKLQLYGMAALFLVLLYDAPAALALYWTLNNLFSLIKNIIIKTRNPMKTTAFGASALSIFALLLGWGRCQTMLKKLALLLVILMMNVPILVLLGRKFITRERKKTCEVTRKDTLRFFCACLIMTLLVGVLIPSAVIRTSPEEFLIPGFQMNPNSFYVGYAAVLAAGTFLVWMGLFFAMANPSWKKKMELGMWVLAALSLVNYMCFGRNYGNMSSKLVFDSPIQQNITEIAVNALVLLGVCAVVILIFYKKKELLTLAGTAIVITMICMSAMNLVGSQKLIVSRQQEIAQMNPLESKTVPLSRNGKNVVVLMMDRAISSFVPHIFNEKPELQQQFDGFTFYPNTISFGGHTNFGLSAIFGGYEYMPSEMNKRDTVLLEEKHNEAMKLMPVLFNQNGYQVSVRDPSYAGYHQIPDLSIYEEYPDIDTAITMVSINEEAETLAASVSNKIFRYSIMRTVPLPMQKILYEGGKYMCLMDFKYQGYSQALSSNLTATGRDEAFDVSWNVMSNLDRMTEITEEAENTFMMMCNNLSHSPTLLQLPDYEPLDKVDNRGLDEETPVRTNAAGEKLVMENEFQIRHYHCNAATYLQIGKWLDFLRENDVYDNTRIIIVSDHGYNLKLRPDWKFDYEEVPLGEDHSNIMFFNPVLLIKDFDSHGLKTDETFMTNADVPTLAMEGLIESPRNPFTGNLITDEKKYSGNLYVSLSGQHSIVDNCGTQYNPDPWAMVSGDALNPENWQVVANEDVS